MTTPEEQARFDIAGDLCTVLGALLSLWRKECATPRIPLSPHPTTEPGCRNTGLDEPMANDKRCEMTDDELDAMLDDEDADITLAQEREEAAYHTKQWKDGKC